MSLSIHPPAPSSGGPEDRRFGALRDPRAFVRVFVGVFFRDVESFYPGCRIESIDDEGPERPAFASRRLRPGGGMDFRLVEELAEGRAQGVSIALFGSWYRIVADGSMGLGAEDVRLIRSMGAVLDLNYQILFRRSRMSILQLLRGMPEDHYVAACLEPSAYTPATTTPSRIAEAILTLRTMALSTYENRRVTTGALVLGPGPGEPEAVLRPTPPGALDFGVELTSLKSLHRLCDGRRTLFLVDRAGKLVDVVDVRQWVARERPEGEAEDAGLDVPCARLYEAHARATREGGHVCLVLSPHQEIKVFAGGVQTFVFAHGRWRVLDPASKFALWRDAVADPRLARVLFQTALELSEERQGGLLVVVPDPALVIGRLIAPEDVLDHPLAGLAIHGEDDPAASVDADRDDAAFRALGAGRGRGDAPSKRSIHYLARGRSLLTLDPAIVEALASLDGALAADGEGRLLAFGAILRHDLSPVGGGRRPPTRDTAEGARTTAAIVASRFGPVLKVSEDGVVSCFLDGERVWDL
ncbi:hypothetical protein [Paludisphaera mucosa]|uniref:DAC domain-containing protein n=1 Tax=Paludisphaera mucosa TaxID=3030827 RepID=A0ABT6FGQ5_9BACT|nr:hypothetical protein [Paludisphaera mucosa]MDG3006757.1 hypothetical protein [Paludisphaera mucosa]